MQKSRHRSLLSLVVAGACALAPLGTPTIAHAQPVPAPAPKLTKPPKLLKFIEAPYPEAERARGKAAAVVLRLTIAATGAVDEAVVVESAGPAFDSAAIDATKRFVFEPAEVDGHPSPIRILYRYEFTLKIEAVTTATFGGTVRERGKKKPLAGVTVELDTGAKATTDAAGVFRFDTVAPGKHVVMLSGDKLTTLRTEETLEAGKQLDATYEVPVVDPASKPAAGDEDDLEIVVTAPALEKQTVTTQIAADQGRKLPGTQGDVLKVVESMPGVARSSAGSGALIVWGAAPDDTRIYVDGVRIPRLYHEGGLRSVVATELVDGVELAPGGYGAAYGRGLGGLVTVKTRRADEKELHATAAIDVLDASAAVRAPITKNLRVAIAGRRSHLQTTIAPFAKDNVEDFFPIPRYYDGQARVSYDLGDGERVSLTGLLSGDSVSRVVASPDPLVAKRDTRETSFYRLYARYEKDVKGGSVSVVPSLGVDDRRLASRFSDVPTEASSHTTIYGARLSWHGKATKTLGVTVGVDAEVSDAHLLRSGSITSPPREGDARVFGQAPLDRLNTDDWKVVTAGLAPYGELDLALFGGSVHFIPGLRFDPNVVSVSRKTPIEGDTPSIGAFRQDAALEPRAALRWEPGDGRTTFKAAYGRYHQPAAAEDLSTVFGNPTLGTAVADHVVLSAGTHLAKTLALETTAFHVTSDGLAMRNPAASPLLSEALLPIGSGRSYGVQALLRKELARGLFGWVSYSMVKSERRDTPDSRYRPSDFDQTHVLTALGSWDLGKGLEVGARVRYSTGFPRTPVVGATYDARRDAYEPRFGQKNTDRIPPFFQVDLRVAKRFKLPLGDLETYVEVQNVTNRENPEEVVYSQSYRDRTFITGLPILPIAGARWSL
ncbi:MAG: TonB family protein / TonB-dependent receptor [Myxococcaceae bacterium]|nr:TonB family protein / TonB-dependent receptor [Myxococcaceae bacterium]